MSATDPVGLRDRARRIVARRRALRVLTAIAVCFALAPLLVLIADGLLALPAALRCAVLPAWVIAGIAGSLALVLALPRLRPDEDTGLVLAERACGDEQRRLTAALQLARMDGELAAAGAQRLCGELRGDGLARGLPPLRLGLWLGLAACGMVLGLGMHLFLPGFFPSVWPRLIDPQGDHPPFSLTKLAIAAAPPRVRVGDPARIEATVRGRHDGLALHARPEQGGAPIVVAMYQVGDGRYAAELAQVGEAMRYWVVGGGTRTIRQRLDVDPVPVLGSVDCTVQAPAYAGLDDEAQRWTESGGRLRISALPGSRLELRPVANRPLAAVQLRAGDGSWWRVALHDGVATLEDPAAVACQLRAEASDGVLGDAVDLLAVERREDTVPTVRIDSPARDAAATPEMRIPLSFAAEDDLGLVTVQVQRGYNGLLEAPRREAVTGRRWARQEVLDLAGLGVAPGDLLVLVLGARDGRPGGGQVASAVERRIEIISESDYNRLLRRRLSLNSLRRKYEAPIARLRELQERLRELAQRRRELARELAEDDPLSRELRELAAQARELAAEVGAMRRREALFALEPQLQEELTEAAEALAKAAEEGRFDELAGLVAEMLEQDLALLTRLAQAHGHVARLRQLIDAEQNTTGRFAPLAGHRRLDDADRLDLRELGGQEDRLADALQDWAELTPKLAEELRALPGGERPAAQLEQLRDGVQQGGAIDAKRRAAQAARGGDGIEAERLAREARDALLALLAACQQCQGACEGAALDGLRLGDPADLLATLRGLGAAAGAGYGLGGAGSAGFGFSLGYGGDDNAGSLPSQAMDLFGPEALDAERGEQRGGLGEDGIAELAAAGDGRAAAAATYQRALRRTAVAGRVELGAELQQVVDEYFRRLDEAP